MYTIFSDNTVFNDPIANIACNTIVDAIDESGIGGDFFLTGLAARIIQGDPLEAVKVISFGTSDQGLFNFSCTVVGKMIGAQGTVVLSDQAQITYNENIYIEVWFLPTPGTLVYVDGIKMQDEANIPPYIL